jgi:uncharacterized protein YndB with AHSA1/START domain
VYGRPVSTSPERACLAIADISGYTSYLAGVELDHAQDILSDLTVTVVEAMAPFQLLKLEGDAAFAYIPGDSIDGSMLQDTIESTYVAFRKRLRDIKQASTCDCNACVRIPDLDLKFVIHHGAIGRQRLMGLDELVGPEVILVHRLLKNEVIERTGIAAYALYTEALVKAAAINPAAQELREHHEQTDVAGDVSAWVADLGSAWQRELDQPRRGIPPERQAFTGTFGSAASPQVVFELLTSPAQRPGWDASIDYIREDSPAGRRGAQTVNHCMHGKDAIVEEILDWRPPEYWMTRTTIPHAPGSPQFLKTEELTRTPQGGTSIKLTLGSVEGRSPAEDEAVLAFVETNIAGAVEAVMATIEAIAADRAQAAGGAPELPARRGRQLSEPVKG